MVFQALYVEWLTTNYQGNKALYLGISPKAWHVSSGRVLLFPRLDCTNEEADDQMFHIQDILCHRTDPTTSTLLSGDTDVFVCLLYHLSINWLHEDLTELWLIHNSGVNDQFYPSMKYSPPFVEIYLNVFQHSMHYLGVIQPAKF